MHASHIVLPIAAAAFAMAATLGGSVASRASTPAPVTTGDAAKGKVAFARCSICHDVAPGVNRLGPSLAGVVGRKAATVPGFNYSPAMKASGIVWTPAQLDAFLIRPSAKVPGTRMMFAGMATPADRANVIAYLQGVK